MQAPVSWEGHGALAAGAALAGFAGRALKRCIVEEMQQFSGCRIH
jgi:hypothetical protein